MYDFSLVPNLRENDFKQIGVAERPSIKDYILLLERVATISSTPTADTRAIALKVFASWSANPRLWQEELVPGEAFEIGFYTDALKTQLANHAVFPTTGGCWRKLASVMFYDDSKNGKVSTSTEGYIQLPNEVLSSAVCLSSSPRDNNDTHLVQKLYETLGLNSLTGSCKEMCDFMGVTCSKSLQTSKELCMAACTIQAWIASHCTNDESEQVERSFKSLSWVITGSISPVLKVFSCHQEFYCHQLQEVPCFYDPTNNVLAMSSESTLSKTLHLVLARQLSKLSTKKTAMNLKGVCIMYLLKLIQ